MVNSYFPPWRGGAETYVYELSKALAARGHEISVICTADPLPPGTSDSDGVRIIRVRRTTRIYGTPIQAGLLGELKSNHVDLFHANFPSPYLASTVALTSFFRRIPAVITWHNDLPPVTAGARFLIETHNRAILPAYIREYRKIIATSEIYRRKSRILTSLGTRVEVINNGVDCERFNPNVNSSAVQARFGLNDKSVVLFVGALTSWHGYKGLDILLEAIRVAAKSVPRILLLVVGEGNLRAKYEFSTEQLGLGRRVIFAGNVSDEELPQFYAASDLVAVPSKDMSEGFGLTILEANASGRACVASNTGGIPEILRDGHNGLLVPPKDPESLAKGIIQVTTNDQDRLRMGENGRKVATTHDWKTVAEQTENVYLRATAVEV